ncbi:Uu.00g114210.m01.CDS01 [Anthostomella pinea]|uniref:Uu.00g114210.m01.CDS01 n=1 Tax=Anthostomella pinea TaxID=933095 RepID=A0AAI8VAG2_9PEZI|nr:Uu.00g114210.m01.CDS01 [Anthostomella pinea]
MHAQAAILAVLAGGHAFAQVLNLDRIIPRQITTPNTTTGTSDAPTPTSHSPDCITSYNSLNSAAATLPVNFTDSNSLTSISELGENLTALCYSRTAIPSSLSSAYVEFISERYSFFSVQSSNFIDVASKCSIWKSLITEDPEPKLTAYSSFLGGACNANATATATTIATGNVAGNGSVAGNKNA